MPHRVVVADDHPLYRSALAELIRRQPDLALVAAVDDLAAALAVLEQEPCDLAVLDIRMPGMDGMDGVRRLRERWPAVKVVLISGDLDGGTVARALDAGATGMLPKSFDPDVITAALRLVLTGATYVPHGLEPVPVPAPARAEPPSSAGPHNLTARELEILRLMATGDAHKEIARTLGIAEVTVKLHAQRIVRKLKVKNRMAAIAKAIKDGLIEVQG